MRVTCTLCTFFYGITLTEPHLLVCVLCFICLYYDTTFKGKVINALYEI